MSRMQNIYYDVISRPDKNQSCLQYMQPAWKENPLQNTHAPQKHLLGAHFVPFKKQLFSLLVGMSPFSVEMQSNNRWCLQGPVPCLGNKHVKCTVRFLNHSLNVTVSIWITLMGGISVTHQSVLLFHQCILNLPGIKSPAKLNFNKIIYFVL